MAGPMESPEIAAEVNRTRAMNPANAADARSMAEKSPPIRVPHATSNASVR